MSRNTEKIVCVTSRVLKELLKMTQISEREKMKKEQRHMKFLVEHPEFAPKPFKRPRISARRRKMLARIKRIIELRRKKISFAEIGRREGITKQRVHQIFKKHAGKQTQD